MKTQKFEHEQILRVESLNYAHRPLQIVLYGR